MTGVMLEEAWRVVPPGAGPPEQKPDMHWIQMRQHNCLHKSQPVGLLMCSWKPAVNRI